MFRLISLSVLLTLIVVLGITFFKVVAPFLLPLFLAGVAAILGQPLFLYLIGRTKGRRRIAAGLATAIIVLAILGPLVVGTAIASAQMYVFAAGVTSSSTWDEVFGTVRKGANSRTHSFAEWLADQINTLRGFEPSATNETDAGVDAASGDAAASESGSDASAAAAAGSPGDESGGGATSSGAEASPIVGATPDVAPEAAAREQGERSAPTADLVDGQTTPASDGNAVMEPTPTGAITAAPLAAASEDSLEPLLRTPQRITPEHLKAFARARAQEFLVSLGDRSLGLVTGVFFSVVSGIVGSFIFAVALYYFFADGAALISATERLVPVHANYQRELIGQFSRAVRSVVSATFLAALGQAVATTFALWLAGFDHLITLSVLCFLSAMIPMLGTWLVWLPCAVVLALGDRWVAAGLLTCYGAAVVGVLDNVIRTYVLNSDTKLHPLLALISVLGGLQVMGLWGIFIGPIVASCLHALIKIFNAELAALSRSRFGDLSSSSAFATGMPAEAALVLGPNSGPASEASPPQAAPPASAPEGGKSAGQRRPENP